jgi:hypothetical protein
VRRNSAAHSWSWKKQLTPDEIERVKTITAPLWTRFYRDEDWGE